MTRRSLESQRLVLQADLDGQKDTAARNKLGQFATPTLLANEVLKFGLATRPPHEATRFLDPAIGTGSFFSALLANLEGRALESASGFEIDAAVATAAQSLWKGSALNVTLGDFTRQAPPPIADLPNLLICNPPYVRHHHLTGDEKLRLQALADTRTGIRPSGLTGLYGHFLLLCHAWMAPGATAGWLIPSEFMDVNYGRALKEYLLAKVTLNRIHRFDPNEVQFEDALVSSAVVWFTNTPPPRDHKVTFSFGGSLLTPKHVGSISTDTLRRSGKWTRFPQDAREDRAGQPRLGDIFQVKRGIATGANGFFILTEEDATRRKIPQRFLKRILVSPRFMEGSTRVTADDGRTRFLFSCPLPPEEVQTHYPAVWRFLEEGLEQGVAEGYLCKSRRFWYEQEERDPPLFFATYMGRGESERPFRFILNEAEAVATNSYLMVYAKSSLEARLKQDRQAIRRLWEALNGIAANDLMQAGRVYGGGLFKLEPKEMANVPADNVLRAVGMTPASATRPRQVVLA